MMTMLNDHVLVLNRYYVPINVTNVKDALKKITASKAEIVTVENGGYCNYDITSWQEISDIRKELDLYDDGDEVLYLSGEYILVPRVIRILTFSKVPERKFTLNRKNVYLRDGNVCQYCGKKFDSEDLNLDHVVPRAQGGISTWKNLVCSCIKCNQKKRDRTPVEAGMKLVRLPYEPKNATAFKCNDAISSIPKYFSWRSFISDIYWNIKLES